MLQDSFHTAEIDKNARALAEARLEVDRMRLATKSALNADAHLLSQKRWSTSQGLINAAFASEILG
jgi:molecular chaperone HscA